MIRGIHSAESDRYDICSHGLGTGSVVFRVRRNVRFGVLFDKDRLQAAALVISATLTSVVTIV